MDKGEREVILKKRWFHWTLCGVCLASFCVMLKFCGYDSLEQDELSMVNYITYTDSLFKAMLTDPAWPPLWKGIMFLWYRMIPYGDRWLILLPELCFLPGIYFVGLIGKEVSSKRVGIIASVLTATNARVIYRIATEITCYSLLFTLSSILVYLYIKQAKSKETYSLKRLVPLLIVMTLASYTHYFGFFLSGTLFLIDCVRVYKKKIRAAYLVPYIGTGILYVPWLLYIITVGGVLSYDYWQPAPSFESYISFLKTLTGDISILYYIAVLGFFIVAGIAVKHVIKGGEVQNEPVIYVLIIPALLTVCVFLYGKYIAIGNTFWVWRYFTSVLPCYFVLSAVGIDEVYSVLTSGRAERQKISAGCMVLCVLFLTVYSSLSHVKALNSSSPEPFRETANWISRYYYDPNTIIVSTSWYQNTDGMIEYYVTHRGQRGDPQNYNIVHQNSISNDKLLTYDRVVLLETSGPGSGSRGARRAEIVSLLNDNDYSITQNVSDRKLYVYERTDQFK